MNLVPLAGTVGSLEPLDQGSWVLTDVNEGDVIWRTDIGGPVWNPERFRLTLEDGRKFVMNTSTGLESMTDLNGNVLTIDTNGIHHSSGKDITFQRVNGDGPIFQIVDPKNQVYYYGYDGAGDLKTYRDPAMASGKAVTYTYDSKHNLKRITDPEGHPAIRTEFDPATGRMISNTDAFGNVIHYNYDLDANTSVVTDRANNPQTIIYDNRGNPVTEIDALGNMTIRTFDALDNKLSEKLPGNSLPTMWEYNDTNNPRLPTKMTDPLGHFTTWAYNAQGSVTYTVDPRGIETTNVYGLDSYGHINMLSSQVQGFPAATYQYDQTGGIRQEIDPNGCKTTYLRDISGAVTTQITANGQPEQLTTTFNYDPNVNMTSETRQNTGGSQTTSYQRNARGAVTLTGYPDGTSVVNTYDSLGHLVGVRDQRLRNKTIMYDALGRPSTIFYPDNTKAIYGYDAEGRRTDATDRGGRTTHTDYDELGRPTTVTFQGGSRRITQYDAQGRVTDTIDENGNRTHYTYDDAGRRLTATSGYLSGQSQEAAFTYDANGNVLTVTVNGRPQVTLNTYDAMNRLTRVDYPDSTFTRTEYDNVGRKTASVDQAGKRTEFSWDGLSRLTEVRQLTSFGTLTTKYGYDKVGNLISQTDANNHTTTYTADVMGRRTSRTLPDGRVERFDQYDATGNPTQKTDFAGNGFTYGYDANKDLLTSVSGPGVSLGYTWDDALFRVRMVDASGPTTFNHNERNFFTRQVSPAGWGTLTFTNTGTGQPNSVVSSNTNGNNLFYGYNSLNLPATIVDGMKTTLIRYDDVGNLDQITLSNGVAVTHSYNSVNQLIVLQAVTMGGFVSSYHYTLGSAGNRVGVTELLGRAVTWVPDDLYRLVSETISADLIGPNGGVTYAYDPVGNRNTRNSSVVGVAPQTFTGGYDTADRLRPTFDFDLNGNQLNDAQGRTFTYNTLNQLTRVQGLGVDISYLYDGDGLRVQKADNLTSVVTKYLWDRNNLTGFPQVSEELQNGNVVRRYVYGPQGVLYMTQLILGNWVTSYVGKDGTGSVRYLMDENGLVTDQFAWDAFGVLLARTGSIPCPVGLHGEFREVDTGLIYLRARWYHPDLGRFLGMDEEEGNQQDPNTLNDYVSFSNDPLNKMDPSGFQFASIGAVGVQMNALSVISVQPQVRVSRSSGFEKSGKVIIKARKLRGPRFAGIRPIQLVNYRHAYVVFKDKNGRVEFVLEGTSENTKGGGSDWHGYLYGFGKLLKDKFSVEPDAVGVVEQDLFNPHGENSEKAYQQLKNDFMRVYNSYKNDVLYEVFPTQGKSGNSNSFAGSIVRKAAWHPPLAPIQEPSGADGWEVDVIK